MWLKCHLVLFNPWALCGTNNVPLERVPSIHLEGYYEAGWNTIWRECSSTPTPSGIGSTKVPMEQVSILHQEGIKEIPTGLPTGVNTHWRTNWREYPLEYQLA